MRRSIVIGTLLAGAVLLPGCSGSLASWCEDDAIADDWPAPASCPMHLDDFGGQAPHYRCANGNQVLQQGDFVSTSFTFEPDGTLHSVSIREDACISGRPASCERTYGQRGGCDVIECAFDQGDADFADVPLCP